MNIPAETRPFLWGAASGALALVIIGFAWGGWTTAGKAEAAAAARSSAAVVGALAPECVERFRRAADAPAQLAALKKVDVWAQGEFVEKGGWVGVPGAKPGEDSSAVAKACAGLLAAG